MNRFMTRLIWVCTIVMLSFSRLWAQTIDGVQGETEASGVHQVAANPEQLHTSNTLEHEISSWETMRGLLDTYQYQEFDAQAYEFLKTYPHSDKAQYVTYWRALVPRWTGNPADTVTALTALINTKSLSDEMEKEAIWTRVCAQFESGDYDAYRSESQRLLSSDFSPEQKSLLRLWIASIPRLEGDSALAITALENYLGASDNTLAHQEQAAFLQLQAYLDTNDLEGLATAGARYLSRYPDSPNASAVQVWIMSIPARQGNLQGSIALAQQFLESDSQDQVSENSVRISMAQWMLQANETVAFNEAIDDFIRDNPQDVRGYELLLTQIQNPEVHPDRTERAQALGELASNQDAPEIVRTEAAYLQVVLQFDLHNFNDLRESAELFCAAYPENKRTDQLELWLASIPLWEGDPAASAVALEIYLQNADRPGELVEQAMSQRTECLASTGQYDLAVQQTLDYRTRFSEGTNLQSIDYYDAICTFMLEDYSIAADKMSDYTIKYPNSALAKEVSYRLVSALHGAHRWDEIDAAADTYLKQYGDSTEAETVAYTRMLVPLNMEEKDWDDAIRRCEEFKRSNPESPYAPNADLNRGIALFSQAREMEYSTADAVTTKTLSMQDNSSSGGVSTLTPDDSAGDTAGDDEITAVRLKAHEAMESFRQAAAGNSMQDISWLDSFYYENDFEGLEREARAKMQARPQICILYLGIALAHQGPERQAEALTLLTQAASRPAEIGTYSEYILADAVRWMLALGLARNDAKLATDAYRLALALPQNPIKQKTLDDCAALQASGFPIDLSIVTETNPSTTTLASNETGQTTSTQDAGSVASDGGN